MGLAHSPRIVTNGLVLCLDAANVKSYPGSGTTWTDLSGSGNNGTLTNGPTFSSGNGGSVVFDGVNDHVNGVHNSTLDLPGDVTVECWFRVTASTGGSWIRVFGKGDNTNRTYGLWYNMSSNWFLYQRYGSGGSLNVPNGGNANYPVNTNMWYHLVGTSIGSNHNLYLNGKSIATGTGSTFYSSTDPYRVGYAGFEGYHLGNISNVKLYNRGLSAAEIQQNFNALRGRYGI